MVGLSDLKGLFQPEWFCVSVQFNTLTLQISLLKQREYQFLHIERIAVCRQCLYNGSLLQWTLMILEKCLKRAKT